MKYPASHLTPFPPAFPGKISCRRILSAKNSPRAPASPLSTFRMNTCKNVSKQRTLSPFRMNTYAKTGGRGVLLLTVSAQCHCIGRASARLASARRGVTPPLHSIQGKPPKSFPSYYIPASQAVSCSYALFCATGFLHLSCFQYLAHSFNVDGGGTPSHTDAVSKSRRSPLRALRVDPGRGGNTALPLPCIRREFALHLPRFPP